MAGIPVPPDALLDLFESELFQFEAKHVARVSLLFGDIKKDISPSSIPRGLLLNLHLIHLVFHDLLFAGLGQGNSGLTIAFSNGDKALFLERRKSPLKTGGVESFSIIFFSDGSEYLQSTGRGEGD